MTRYEYKVIPAPTRGEKAKGAKTPADRFAHAMTLLMNEMGRDGWDYIRADTLPAEERAGFTRKVTVYQNLLTFRRSLPAASDKPATGKQAAKDPADIPMVPLKAREPAASTAPRISVRDDTAPLAPTIKLGAAARLPDAAEKPTPSE
ncbi:MAG: DUF4177 domain-containing protein [Albidovulum sp.]